MAIDSDFASPLAVDPDLKNVISDMARSGAPCVLNVEWPASEGTHSWVKRVDEVFHASRNPGTDRCRVS